jgi:ribonuclease VapC
MVIDTFGLVALLLNEAAASRIASAIEISTIRPLSAANYLETSIVIESRKGEVAGRELDLLLYRAAIEIAPVDQGQVDIARHAWRLYGKGRHQAGLNYGDCFAYALAKQRSMPLLFCGANFAHTDIAKVPF